MLRARQCHQRKAQELAIERIWIACPLSTRFTGRVPDCGGVDDPVGLGLVAPVSNHLDALTREFLGATPIEVTNQHRGSFATMLDREHLDMAE